MLKALILTIFIEGILVFLFSGSGKLLAVSVAGNLFTNPLLNLLRGLGVVSGIKGVGALALLVVLELAAVLAETVLYVRVGEKTIRTAAGLSLAANVLSFFVGGFLLGSLSSVA